MAAPVDGGRTTANIIALTAIALAGFLFSITPAATSLDNRIMDIEWRALRKLEAKALPDDVIIVGVDAATVKSISAPPELWHEPLGRALEKIAAAKPRAIGLDYPLPDRSYDAIHPGLDRALFRGIAAAVENGPFVVALNIDPRTRTARPIHAPFLALLGDKRLGIGLAARDGDGETRRFSLLIPTEDGGFPTFAGRLCRALSTQCTDGLIDYSLGPPLRYVPLYDVLAQPDPGLMSRLFRNRIVLIGDVEPYTDRIAVPVNLASWEGAGSDSPGVVVHAQTLRTALGGAAPREVLRPVIVIIVLLAALPFLLRDWRFALGAALFGVAGLACGALYALHTGLYVPVSAALLTVILAGGIRVFLALRTKSARAPNIQHSG